MTSRPTSPPIRWLLAALFISLGGCAAMPAFDGPAEAPSEPTLTERRESRTAAAIDSFDRQRATILLKAARSALDRGDVEDGGRHLRGAVGAEPDNPRIPLKAALLALEHNRADLSVDLLRSAVVDFPQHAPLHRALGAALYRAGDYAGAETALRQALSLDKSDPLSYLLMGCTLAKLGQSDAAGQHYATAARLDPTYRNVPRR